MACYLVACTLNKQRGGCRVQHGGVPRVGSADVRDVVSGVGKYKLCSAVPSANGLFDVQVLKVHLPDAGITDFGHITSFGFGTTRTAPLELFINGKPTRFAQWPNEVTSLLYQTE